MVKIEFSRFPLKSYLLTALEQFNFVKPTEIQEKVIPLVLNGNSVVGQSQTGTGKTLAFLLPILTKINPERTEVQAVITAPTRELASQIYQEVLRLVEFDTDKEKVTAKLFVGGTDKSRDIERLKNPPHLVIGTPGRINDLRKEGALTVHKAAFMVVDEADMTLEMGFLEDVDQIAASFSNELQMLVFSATIPEKLRPFLKKYMENPSFVQISPKEKTSQNIEHVLVPVRSRNKLKLLYEVATSYNPYLAIIFANTKKTVDLLADSLSERGLKVGIIHGDLAPRERKQMMNRIRNLEFQYIVATDLASRGIDIEGVSHVIQYELPRDVTFYVHRAGRTGRSQFTGISTTLYEPNDEKQLVQLEKLGIDFKYMDVVNGEWTEIRDRNERRKRKKEASKPEVSIPLPKKPKKVKPGYKKKYQEEVKRRLKRQRKRNKL